MCFTSTYPVSSLDYPVSSTLVVSALSNFIFVRMAVYLVDKWLWAKWIWCIKYKQLQIGFRKGNSTQSKITEINLQAWLLFAPSLCTILLLPFSQHTVKHLASAWVLLSPGHLPFWVKILRLLKICLKIPLYLNSNSIF